MWCDAYKVVRLGGGTPNIEQAWVSRLGARWWCASGAKRKNTWTIDNTKKHGPYSFSEPRIREHMIC